MAVDKVFVTRSFLSDIGVCNQKNYIFHVTSFTDTRFKNNYTGYYRILATNFIIKMGFSIIHINDAALTFIGF